MNPYNNIYSYSPSSNYQTNKISQYTSQNWNIKYYNNFSSQNQKNDLWNDSQLNCDNNAYLNNNSSLNNSNNSKIYNNSFNNNQYLKNKNQIFLNPYNFPSLKNNDYSIEKPKPTNYNSSQNNYQNNNFQNKNYNIWNSSLSNNPISMYTNDYNKAKILTENSNKNSYISSYNNNHNYNTNKYNYSPYNYNNNTFNNTNNKIEIEKDNLLQNKNNIITEKKEELIKENKPEITYDSSKVETWGDFTKYWIFLHHHNVVEGLQNLIYSKKNFFVFMYGTHDSKGRSWCSDCIYAEPNVNLIKGIIASKEKEKEVYFVNIPIDKEKKPFYKKNEILKMIHVPTLIYFEYGKEIRRIIQDELFNKDRVVDFVMKTYKRF